LEIPPRFGARQTGQRLRAKRDDARLILSGHARIAAANCQHRE
jgi:hypothetical protein